jgi:hypothetical protein
MAVATTTALLIGAGISAGVKAYGAHKQASAANKAADQQVASADQGLALQKDIYGQQVAGMQPYAQFGQQALGSLGSLMGFPAQTVQGPQGMPASSLLTLPNPPAGRQATPETTTGVAVPRVGTIGAMTRSTYQPTPQGGSVAVPRTGLVKVASPQGEIREVPEAIVPQLEAYGGRRV